MTLLYSDPRFREHLTGAHPEHPRRLVVVEKLLDESGLRGRCTQPKWESAKADQIALAHDRSYVKQVEQFAASGGGRIEIDTVLSERSFEVAVLAAGAVCDAVRRVVTGDEQTALCLVRPPGHHARPNAAMGFCLFDSVAVGAKEAIFKHALDRVLIVDWDVHHGNGTQEIFWDDGRVGFLSIHRWPFYPGTGDCDETGSGPGLGMISNLPVEFGTPLEEYHDRFERALTDLAGKIKPQLILISAGFDAHRQDPVGSLELEVEDFGRLTQVVLDVAREYAGGRVASVLEGGYNPQRLAESVGVHLECLLAAGNSPPAK
jgi:acetoin utilization deacetylase AcuC-like enzyme